MERTEKILDALVQSDSAFRSQFDRESQNFHQGDPTPVPLGGERIPESMQGKPQTTPEEQKIPDDPLYQKTLNTRSYLQEYKKIVSAVCPAVEAKIRAKQSKDQENKDKLVLDADAKIHDILNLVREGKAKLFECSDVVNDFSQDIDFILDNALLDFQSKEDYGEFMLKVSAFNKKIFKEIQTLLQKLKDIKKNKALV
jgi:hypothetical protein